MTQTLPNSSIVDVNSVTSDLLPNMGEMANNPDLAMAESTTISSHPTIANLLGEAYSTEGGMGDSYLPVNVHPMAYRRFDHGPWTLTENQDEGYYDLVEIIQPTIPTPKIDWIKILQYKDEISIWTQHIMEHRESIIDFEETSAWAQNILGLATYGTLTKQIRDRFGISYIEDWEPTQFQLALEHSLQVQAQEWFKSRELGYKLRRLMSRHRRWQQIHLWARKRATWPTKVMGPEPTSTDDINIVFTWCRAKVIESDNRIPRALTEYENWWMSYRASHRLPVKEIGDHILLKAKTLQTYLDDFRGNNNSVTLRRIYFQNKPQDFGVTTECSCLEQDVWKDCKASLAPHLTSKKPVNPFQN